MTAVAAPAGRDRRMRGLPIVRVTLLEAVSRRLALWGVALSVVFLGLFWLGFALLQQRVGEFGEADARVSVVAASMLTLLGMYVVSFLASFLALMLSVGSVSAEADGGTLQAVLARPLRRRAWLLQRWGALAAVAGSYSIVMGAALLIVARLEAGYTPLSPVRALLLLAAQTVAVLTLGLVASTRLSTVAAGVVAFSLFGLAWLGGIIEFIGTLIANSGMVNTGIAVSLLMPSDALWRGASFYVQTPLFIQGAVGGAGLPFASNTPPSAVSLWWALGWTCLLLVAAVRRFSRRDL